MKKICYVLDYFPSISETFIYNEIKELVANGYDVTIYARNDTQKEDFKNDLSFLEGRINYLIQPELEKTKSQILSSALRAYPLSFFKTLLFELFHRENISEDFLLLSAKLALDSKKEGFEHFHAHFATGPAHIAMLTSKITGKPFTFTVHAYDIFKSQNLLREKMDASKAVVSISDYNTRFLLEYYPGFSSEKIRQIACGIDLNLFKFSTRDFSNKELNIISVARLVEKKGLKYLIEACGGLKEKKIPFRCEIIGEGPLKGELTEQIEKLKLGESIDLRGAISSRTRVITRLNKANIFVLPSVEIESGDRDSRPVSIMEAMAIGLPVISTKEFGIPEMVEEGTGILVKSKSVESLTTGLIDFYRMTPSKKRSLALAARKKAENMFDIHKEVKKLIRVFEE